MKDIDVEQGKRTKGAMQLKGIKGAMHLNKDAMHLNGRVWLTGRRRAFVFLNHFDRESETALAFRSLPSFAHAVPLALFKCFNPIPWTRVQG